MENTIEIKRYRVPQDLFFDILRIVLRSKMRYRIEGIKGKENIIQLQVHMDSDYENHELGIENIEDLLNGYGKTLSGMYGADSLFIDGE
ncbi:MAG: hypothetical protein ACHQRM_17145 [Bacteroidia bacterium]